MPDPGMPTVARATAPRPVGPPTSRPAGGRPAGPSPGPPSALPAPSARRDRSSPPQSSRRQAHPAHANDLEALQAEQPLPDLIHGSRPASLLVSTTSRLVRPRAASADPNDKVTARSRMKSTERILGDAGVGWVYTADGSRYPRRQGARFTVRARDGDDEGVCVRQGLLRSHLSRRAADGERSGPERAPRPGE